MVSNSLIIGFFAHILGKIRSYYQSSFLHTLLSKVIILLKKSKEQSVIIGTLGAESILDIRWQQSTFYKVLSAPIKAMHRVAARLYQHLEEAAANSRVLLLVNSFLSNALHYSLRSYGFFFLALFGVEAALWMLLQSNDMKLILARAGLIGFSLVLVLLDIPVASLVKGSVLYRFIENGFVDQFIPYDESKGKQAGNLVSLILLGAAAGVVAYLLPLKLAALAVGAALAAVLILWRYEAGVYLAAGFAALMPTTAMYFVIALTIVSFIGSWAGGKLPKYKPTSIDALMIFLVGILSYSTLTSYFLKNSLSVLIVHLLLITFFFILTRTINTKYKLYLLITLLVITGALTSLYGVYQYFGGTASAAAWVDQTMFEDIQSRVGSTFNNPNILGEYLILMIPMAIGVLWYNKKLVYKGLFVAMLAVMGICMLMTFSRGAWLGLIVALVAFSIVRDRRLFVLFLIALIIMPFALPDTVMNRFTSIGSLSDTSSSYRLSILLGSLRMVENYWISGIGLGDQAFKAIYPKYSLAAAYAHHSHNVYLQMILEMGVAGALVFALILYVFFRAMLAHQAKTRDSFLSSVMIAAGAGVAGYMVQGLVENVWYNYRVLHIFWVVVAVGFCALRLGKGKVQEID